MDLKEIIGLAITAAHCEWSAAVYLTNDALSVKWKTTHDELRSLLELLGKPVCMAQPGNDGWQLWWSNEVIPCEWSAEHGCWLTGQNGTVRRRKDQAFATEKDAKRAKSLKNLGTALGELCSMVEAEKEGSGK